MNGQASPEIGGSYEIVLVLLVRCYQVLAGVKGTGYILSV